MSLPPKGILPPRPKPKPEWKTWRVRSDHRGSFDELVVGNVLHLEMMDDKLASLFVGERMFSIWQAKDGTIQMRQTEGDPVIGPNEKVDP